MLKTLARRAVNEIALRALDHAPAFLIHTLQTKYAPIVERIVLGERFGGHPGALDDRFRAAYAANQWIYRCVTVKAANIAQVPLQANQAVRRAGELVQEPLAPDHFIQDVLDRPNEHQTTYDLKFLTVCFLELAGDAFWLLGRMSNGRVGGVTTLRPDRVRILPHEELFVGGYEYTLDGKKVTFPPENVIHFKYSNPNDDYRGQSVLQAARDTVTENAFAQAWSKSFYKNAAIPKGGLSFDQKLEPPDYTRIRREWNRHHQGVDNANKVAIFEKGASWLNLSPSQRDMEFVLQRRMTRDDLGAVFGVPPVLLNSYERATYNNANTQERLFWRNTAIPITELLRQTLALNAVKFYGSPSQEARRTTFSFDLSNVWALQEEALERSKMQVELVRCGLRTANEVRETDNLEPLGHGDVWWRNQSLVPTVDATAGVVASPAGAQAAAVASVPAATVATPAPTEAPVLVEVRARRSEKRQAQHVAFIAQSDYYQRLMRGFVTALFKDQLEQMLANLRAVGQQLDGMPTEIQRALALVDGRLVLKADRPYKANIDSIVFDLDAAQQFTDEAATPLYERMAEAGGKRGFSLAEVDGTFDLNDPLAQEHMLAKKQKLAKKVNETTWRHVTGTLEQGMDEGESIAQLASRLSDTMLDRSADRYRIAQTEVLGCMNGGLHDGFEQTGKVKGSTWSSALSEATRDAHWSADGQTVALNKKFRVGGEQLRYPGDPDGSAGNIINCVCTTFPVLVDVV